MDFLFFRCRSSKRFFLNMKQQILYLTFLYMLSLWNRIEKKSVYCMPTKRPILFFLILFFYQWEDKRHKSQSNANTSLLHRFKCRWVKSLKGYSTFSLLSIWYNFTYYIVVVVVVVVDGNLSHFWYCQKRRRNFYHIIWFMI